MMLKEKGDLRPLLLKFGVAVALSFAGFLYSRFISPKIKPSFSRPRSDGGVIKADMGEKDGYKDDDQALKISPTSNSEEMCMQQISIDDASVGLSSSIRHDGDDFLLPECNDFVEECDLSVNGARPSPKKELETLMANVDSSTTFRNADKPDYEQEIKRLRNMVKTLRDRERNLEVQLLEYYGLKEKEATVLELQNRLKINNMETKLFTLKIEFLQSENKKLKGQVADHAITVADLEAARSEIKLLNKKLRYETEQNREQILRLRQRVARLQEEELKAPESKHDIESKLQRLQVLEGEAEELRNSNRILQIENYELSPKLESTKMVANSVLENSEIKTSNEVSNCMKQQNEELRKQIEQLQSNRCADVEELVYLRWINACLRYELRNFQPPTGKAVARDLSRSLSPKSEEKAKKLILEYAQTEGMRDAWMHSLDFNFDDWSSTQTSVNDTGEPDDSSFENTSTTKTNSSAKRRFFNNLRRLLTGKDSHHHGQAPSTCNTDQTDVDSLIWTRSRSPSHSLDVSGGTSMSFDHIKDSKTLRSSSYCGYGYGSRSHRYKSFILGRDDASDSTMDSLLKSDLVKFAEVLNESKPRRAHRKSASII